MRHLALIALMALSPNLGAQSVAPPVVKGFAPPAGDGGFGSGVLGAPPPPPKVEVETGSLLFDAVMPPPPKLWFGGFEFGMNGSQGNTDVLNIRLGINARRETPTNSFQTGFLSTYSLQDGVVNSNKALWSAIDEIKWRDSKWSPFVSEAVEYDQFRAYDFRVAGHAGASYRFIQNDWTLLKGRAGAGSSAEFSSVNDVPTNWVPEGLLGYDFEYKLNARQRFVSYADYFPDISGQNRFRVRFRAAYEILLDPGTNLTLRLGVQDRFDSEPGPATRQNDIDYFTTLIFQF